VLEPAEFVFAVVEGAIVVELGTVGLVLACAAYPFVA